MLAGAVLLGALDAHAGEPEEYPYVDFAAGTGLSVGRHGYGSTDYSGRSTYTERSLHGGVVDLTITPAYALPKLSLGVAFDATLVAALGETDMCAGVVSASAVAMLRHARPGFFALLAVGYASGGSICSSDLNETGITPGSYYGIEAGTGPRAALGFGYQSSSGFGFETTASYTYLSGEDSKYQPVMIVFQALLSGR